MRTQLNSLILTAVIAIAIAACRPRTNNENATQSILDRNCVPGDKLRVNSPNDGFLNLRTPDTKTIIREALHGEIVECAGTADDASFALVKATGCEPVCAAHRRYLDRVDPTSVKTPTPTAPSLKPVDAFGALQAVTVTTENWDSTTGVLRTFQRDNVASQWQKTGFQIDVVIGRSGMAWGRGLHPKQTNLKEEGDGTSPAGIFSLGTSFGYDAAVTTGLRYEQMTADHWCVDDANQSKYNQIVRRSEDAVGESSEMMRRGDILYKYGIFINHNPEAVKGGGSCVFVHVWRAPGKSTAGCTAMTEANIKQLLAWLQSSKKPILITMPADTYQSKRDAWGLPKIW